MRTQDWAQTSRGKTIPLFFKKGTLLTLELLERLLKQAQTEQCNYKGTMMNSNLWVSFKIPNRMLQRETRAT